MNEYVGRQSKNTTIIVIYKVLVYIQISANHMFWPLLVRPSSSWIPSPRTAFLHVLVYLVLRYTTGMTLLKITVCNYTVIF